MSAKVDDKREGAHQLGCSQAVVSRQLCLQLEAMAEELRAPKCVMPLTAAAMAHLHSGNSIGATTAPEHEAIGILALMSGVGPTVADVPMAGVRPAGDMPMAGVRPPLVESVNMARQTATAVAADPTAPPLKQCGMATTNIHIGKRALKLGSVRAWVQLLADDDLGVDGALVVRMVTDTGLSEVAIARCVVHAHLLRHSIGVDALQRRLVSTYVAPVLRELVAFKKKAGAEADVVDADDAEEVAELRAEIGGRRVTFFPPLDTLLWGRGERPGGKPRTLAGILLSSAAHHASQHGVRGSRGLIELLSGAVAGAPADESPYSIWRLAAASAAAEAVAAVTPHDRAEAVLVLLENLLAAPYRTYWGIRGGALRRSGSTRALWWGFTKREPQLRQLRDGSQLLRGLSRQ